MFENVFGGTSTLPLTSLRSHNGKVVVDSLNLYGAEGEMLSLKIVEVMARGRGKMHVSKILLFW